MRNTHNSGTCRKWWSLVRFLKLNPALAAALLLVATILTFWDSERLKVDFDLRRTAAVKGWVSRTPEARSQALYFELAPWYLRQGDQRYPYPDHIAVWVSSSLVPPDECFDPPLRYGEIVEVKALLREPSYYATPGVQDQRWVAWVKGTPYRIQLKSPSQLVRLGQTGTGRLLSPIFTYLNQFETFSQKVLSEQTLKLLLGVFLGRKYSLEERERTLIKDLGILHLFVVSGFHVSLLLLITHGVFRLLGRFGYLLTLSTVWTYILAIGFPLPALRAGIVASIAYLMFSMGLKQNLLNGLGLSALLIISYSPRSVFSVSFQLSYLCLLAIGLIALPQTHYVRAVAGGIKDVYNNGLVSGREPDYQLRRRVRFHLELCLKPVPSRTLLFSRIPLAKTISYTMTLLVCSLSIQLLLLPVALYYTNRWSLGAVMNNLVLMPAFSVLVVLSLCLFLTYWTPAGPFFSWFLELCATGCMHLTEFLASWSRVLYLPHPDLPLILLYLTAAVILSKCFARAAIIWLGLPVILLLHLEFPFEKRADNDLAITLLDVGQGESIHLRYPNGQEALIDTGGFPRAGNTTFVGERLVARYLWEMQTPGLSYVLITHPDIDHSQGYTFLKEAFRINRLFFFEPLPTYDSPRTRLSAGDSFYVGNVSHFIHHPPLEANENRKSNDNSIVMTLSFKSFSMLFTGDIGHRVEASLVHSLKPVTVLKVAHHGSRTSSSKLFLDQIQPQVALVSAGRSHAFGHPDPAVISRLRESGSRVFSTAALGSLRVTTCGKNFSLQRYALASGRFETLLSEQSLGKPPDHARIR